MLDVRKIIPHKTTFSCADLVTPKELRGLGLLSPQTRVTGSRFVAAVWTGEIRPLYRGEWYLSGACIEAYKTRSDLRDSHYIAKLVVVESPPVPWVKDAGSQDQTTKETSLPEMD